jgi:hypothetical protein
LAVNFLTGFDEAVETIEEEFSEEVPAEEVVVVVVQTRD